jgi:hypothetical protein
MRRRTLVIGLSVLALGVASYRPLLARFAAPLTVDVVSTDPAHQVEFALRGFRSGLEPISASETLRTPYHLELRGAELYALVRRTSADGALRVTLRNGAGASGVSSSDVTMLVASGDHIGVTGFAH